MGKIVVDIMLKDEILDPQGKVIAASLKRLEIQGFKGVRQGKRFELEVEGAVTSAHLQKAKEAAEKLLVNEVIEKIVGIYEDSETSTAKSPSNIENALLSNAAATIAHDAETAKDDLLKLVSAVNEDSQSNDSSDGANNGTNQTLQVKRPN